MARCANDIVLVADDRCGSSPPEKEADDGVKDGERDRRGRSCIVEFDGVLVLVVGMDGGPAVLLPLGVGPWAG